MKKKAERTLDEHMEVHLDLCRRVFIRMSNDGSFEEDSWRKRMASTGHKQVEDKDDSSSIPLKGQKSYEEM